MIAILSQPHDALAVSSIARNMPVAGFVLDATLPRAAFLPTSTVHCRVCLSWCSPSIWDSWGCRRACSTGSRSPSQIAAMGTLIVASSAMATCSSPTDAGFAGRAGVGDRDRRLHPAPECSTCHSFDGGTQLVC